MKTLTKRRRKMAVKKDEIKQREIQELVDLDSQQSQLAALIREKRADIEARLLEGAVVEQGSCFAVIDRGYRKQSCSKSFLTEILGKEKAEALWDKLGNKPYETLEYGKSQAATVQLLNKLEGKEKK